MSFVRLRCVDEKYYASLVRSYREEGKVRQEVLRNYGRVRRGFLRRVLKMRPSQSDVDRAVEK